MITILCSGSRGDFQPYIALAQQLHKLGRNVRIVGGKSMESLIRSYGIGFYEVSADYQTANIDPKLLKDAQSSDNPVKMLMTFHKMKGLVLHLTEEMYHACEGSELILYHPGCTIGYFAGVAMGIPSILASPFPMHKTREVASVIAYGRYPLPSRLTYSMLQAMLWTASKPGVTAFLKKEFGKLPKNFGCPFERVDTHHPAIVSCSNHVFPSPHDWNINIRQYGYWFTEESVAYEPPQALAEFLCSGERPVYIGFGSVFQEDEKAKTIELILSALKKEKKRGILCGMGDIPNLPNTVIAIDSIAHTWLFDKVSAVCHHGGAGTTAAGFRAGVPSVIIPFSNDQFAWAHRAYDLGVGSKPVYRKNLTADALANAIDEAASDTMAQKAAELGRKIRSEAGAQDAAKLVASLL